MSKTATLSLAFGGTVALLSAGLWLGFAGNPVQSPQAESAGVVTPVAFGDTLLVCPPGVVDPQELLGVQSRVSPSGALGDWAFGDWALGDEELLEGGGTAYAIDQGVASGLSAAGQSSGDLLSFDLLSCQVTSEVTAFAAGSTEVGESIALILSNPGDKPSEVEVAVFDSDSPSEVSSLTVPARSTVYVSPGSWSRTSSSPGIVVSSTGSGVAAWLQSSGSEGEVPRGLSRVEGQAPSRDIVLPRIATSESQTLTVSNPGDETAEVSVSLMTGEGTVPLEGFSEVTALPGGVLQVDLSGLPSDALALRLQSDRDIVAGISFSQAGEPHQLVSDMTYASRTLASPMKSVVDAQVPSLQELTAKAEDLGFSGVEASLVTANLGAEAVEVQFQGKKQDLQPDSTLQIPLAGGASPAQLSASAQIHAALVVSVQTSVGTVTSIVPLGSSTNSQLERVVSLTPAR